MVTTKPVHKKKETNKEQGTVNRSKYILYTTQRKNIYNIKEKYKVVLYICKFLTDNKEYMVEKTKIHLYL